MTQLIECIPNFSEGNNPETIRQICHEVETMLGVKLLHVDSGAGANRTVVTFAGTPTAACEAAFKAIKKAAELIDMRTQKGAHPRIGATDVCPLVPLSNISIDETAAYARLLANRVADELGIPVYLYESAAQFQNRKNLANCRMGEYEGLPEKLTQAEWQPDFGPNEFNATVRKTGATIIGARNFLVAYNVNLNTKSVEIANYIAGKVRESGQLKREDNSPFGTIWKDENGNTKREFGRLKKVKGLGWHIEEYGFAQLSYNLTDLNTTRLHQVFDVSCEVAEAFGVKVTGSELIGLIPLKAMLDAGTHYLKKQQLSIDVSEDTIIDAAVKYMGLDELGEFDPKKRIIDYLIDLEILDKTK